MPFTSEIDSHLRIVFTRAIGSLTRQDFFDYQKEARSSPEHRYFDECVDLSAAGSIEGATEDNMTALAELAVEKDDPARPSKLAIIAVGTLHFGLARMYETYRGLHPKHARKVAVFRTRDEALRWLAGERPLTSRREKRQRCPAPLKTGHFCFGKNTTFLLGVDMFSKTPCISSPLLL